MTSPWLQNRTCLKVTCYGCSRQLPSMDGRHWLTSGAPRSQQDKDLRRHPGAGKSALVKQASEHLHRPFGQSCAWASPFRQDQQHLQERGPYAHRLFRSWIRAPELHQPEHPPRDRLPHSIRQSTFRLRSRFQQRARRMGQVKFPLA